MAIRVGILGYGNLGRGVECAVKHNPDMELKAVFTRRNPDSLSILTEGAKVCRAEDVLSMKDQIDVMILCGGSATDLPGQTPEMAAHFNVIDSFDTHANIPRHFEAVDRLQRKAVMWELYLLAGIRACFPLTGSMPMPSCRAAVIIPSGARASARAIPTQSAESKA